MLRSWWSNGSSRRSSKYLKALLQGQHALIQTFDPTPETQGECLEPIVSGRVVQVVDQTCEALSLICIHLHSGYEATPRTGAQSLSPPFQHTGISV